MRKGRIIDRDSFWSWLLVVAFVIFWVPTLNVQQYLTPGDMGRDLYAFQSTLQGRWFCRDYWWQYGPLMPLYYAFWFLVGGVNLISLRWALGLIYLAGSLVTYRTLRLFTSQAVAFLSALAFFNLNITWTFNHLGAVPLLFLAIFSLWKFFLDNQVRWNYAAVFALAGMALIKTSTGIPSFLAFYSLLLVYFLFFGWKERKPPFAGKHLALFPLLFAALVLSPQIFITGGLPFEQAGQCLPFQPVDRGGYHSPWVNFTHLVLRFMVWEPSRLIGIAVLLALAGLAFWGIRKRPLRPHERKAIPWVLGSLGAFALANSVEYFLMEGMIYRFDFWILPLLILLMGLLTEWASPLGGKGMRTFLGTLVLFALLWIPFRHVKEAWALKVPERYLDFPHGRVYLGGALSSVEAIREGTRFILENTKPGQEILTVPYDPLYCFLSGRAHAVREFIFMEHMTLTEKREREIIQSLEAKQVPLVLISNRYVSKEPGVGEFGKTHCIELARYIQSHYHEVRTYGFWDPGSETHAVKIYQRSTS